jgi:arylsulfatase A-like enzyme
MMDMIDRSVERVVRAVEEAGEMDNTLFVFIADHGELAGSYGLFGKGAFQYDCLLQVPCFMSWQGHINAGERVSGLCEEIDIAPTVLDLVGLPITPGIQGIDLVPGLRGKETLGRPWVFSESWRSLWGPWVECFTLRTRTAKLNYYTHDRAGCLFDLSRDPGEQCNLFESRAHRGLREGMMANLLECLHNQKDPIPRVTTQF